jgi:hypothetical protein
MLPSERAGWYQVAELCVLLQCCCATPEKKVEPAGGRVLALLSDRRACSASQSHPRDSAWPATRLCSCQISRDVQQLQPIPVRASSICARILPPSWLPKDLTISHEPCRLQVKPMVQTVRFYDFLYTWLSGGADPPHCFLSAFPSDTFF